MDPSPPQFSTSTTLVAGLVARDPQAWHRFVHWVGPLLYHWCREAGLPAADREDIVQEVFRSVLAALPALRRDDPERNFRGWLFVITRNKLRDLAREKNRRRAVEVAMDPYGQVEGLASERDESEANMRMELFRRSLEYVRAEFEPRSWQAFWRTTVDGLTATEVAAELEMSPAAVRKCRSRISARLREDLDDLLGSARQSRTSLI